MHQVPLDEPLSEVANAAQALLGISAELRSDPGVDTGLANRLNAQIRRLVGATREMRRAIVDRGTGSQP